MITFQCYEHYKTNIANKVCKFAVVAEMDSPHATAYRGYSSQSSAMRALKRLRAENEQCPMSWARVRESLGIR